jgi:hypothetical protein
MITIIENSTTKSHQYDLAQEILGEKFDWYYRGFTSGGECPNFAWIHDENTEECFQFIHVTTSKSSINPMLTPLLYNIADIVGYKLQLQRVKINLMLPNPERKNPISYNRPHVDHSRPDAMTAIYYVNDSDGETVIFENDYTGEDPGPLRILKRFTPKAGTLIVFPSKLYHASSSPSKGKRSVINFIFWKAPEVDPADPFGPVILPPHLNGFLNK